MTEQNIVLNVLTDARNRTWNRIHNKVDISLSNKIRTRHLIIDWENPCNQIRLQIQERIQRELLAR